MKVEFCWEIFTCCLSRRPFASMLGKPMISRLFMLASAVSLLLVAATIAFWVSGWWDPGEYEHRRFCRTSPRLGSDDGSASRRDEGAISFRGEFPRQWR